MTQDELLVPARRALRTTAALLVTALFVLSASLWGTSQIRERADARLAEALALSELQTATLELGGAENVVALVEHPTASQTAALRDALANYERAVSRADVGLTSVQRARLGAAEQSYLSATRLVDSLVDSGRRSEALLVDRNGEAPAYHRLRTLTAALAAASRADANRGRRQADMGLYAILVLMGLGVACLAGGAGVSRRRADRVEAEAIGVRRSESRFRVLADHGGDIVIVTDAAGCIREARESIHHILGYRGNDLCGTDIAHWVHPDDARSAAAMINRVAGESAGWVMRAEWRWRHSDGRWRNIESSISNLLAYPEVGGIVINARDVTERRQLEDELRHRAFHDSLTGLANRALLNDRICHAMARPSDGTTALVMLDLDGLKTLNDSLGHPAGDHALTVVADRLRCLVRPADTVARLAGDEFAVLLEDAGTRDDVQALTARVLAGLAEPMEWEGQLIASSACAGIAFAEAGSHGPADLLRNADIALYAGKAAGRSQLRTFEPAMGDAVLDNFVLESDMRAGLEKCEFFLHYQPVVELDTERIVGFEALVRWAHPTRGTVSPVDFIPMAEESGLIVPLGRWVLRQACRDAVRWSTSHQGHDHLQIGVNLSVRQLQDEDVIDDVASVLAETGLEPSRLVLEITESVLMQGVERALERLNALKALGVRLAVDDFGTGYSSLAYLARFPFDTIKIDKSFVDDVATPGRDEALVEAIITLSEAMHLETLAEGIESADQAATLNRLRCRLGQGFHFAKPLGEQDVDALLTEISTTGHHGANLVRMTTAPRG